MVNLQELVAYLNLLLEPQHFNDYCPNGLQIAGKPTLKNLVVGVTACQALIDQAIQLKADAILVHHGFFWKGEDPRLIGIKHQRIKALIANDISLIAYHLPLDAHPVYGNNKQLANVLDIDVEQSYEVGQNPNLLWVGSLAQHMSASDLTKLIYHKLQREPLHIAGTKEHISRVGWCTGGAQDFLEQAALHQIDAYITGEVSERTVHIAREIGVHFYSAGHHATERYGVKALGEHVAHYFGIAQQFIEIENPV